jgi:hypothetical protein
VECGAHNVGELSFGEPREIELDLRVWRTTDGGAVIHMDEGR